MSAWTEHAMWWHVYPLGFLGADTTGGQRHGARTLRDLIPWLDHVRDLGLNGLALGPVFESATHGYDTIDHFRIDSRLGDEADFDALVAAARDRGIRVTLDGVFNHVGRDFELLRSGADGWLRRGADGEPETFEGHDQLIALDHGSDTVVEHVTHVMTHWLGRGVDGWRLDAAYSMPPAFWRRVLPAVRDAFPEVYVFGEVLHGDYAGFVRESGVDSVTQYELWKAIWSSLEQRNFFELDWTLRRHSELLDTFVPYTFVGNHDVTRIASQIGDERHRAHAAVVLFTVGGAPAVYAGDEFGMQGIKEHRAGGDDAVRPAFPDRPASLDGVDAETLRVHQELIALRRRNPWLHRARVRTVTLENERLVYESSAAEGRLTVAMNLTDAPFETGVVGRRAAGGGEERDGAWVVPPHGWLIIG